MRFTYLPLLVLLAACDMPSCGSKDNGAAATDVKYNPGYSTIVDKTPDSDPLVANGHRIGVVIVEGEDDENGNPLPPLLCGYDLDESPNLRTSSAGQAFFANTGSGGECFPLAVAMTPGKHGRSAATTGGATAPKAKKAPATPAAPAPTPAAPAPTPAAPAPTPAAPAPTPAAPAPTP